MYREIKTKRTKIKAIASWLSRATFVHKNRSLPYDDFLDDAKNIYNNHVIGRVEANRVYGSYKITILIGQPDFEDTIGCKLPAAYLVFDTDDTEVVKISNIINAKPELDYLSRGGFRNRRIQSEYYTSMHPHVSSSGTPCLGSWSNSWAHALVNVNIPLLINVAKNFINTHTPNDAYWGFSEIWEAYNALRVELRDIISKEEFVETMLITKKILHTRINTVNINRGKLTLADSVQNSEFLVSIKQENLIQLIFGYQDVQDLIFCGALKSKKSVINILNVLFPKHLPGMSPVDYF